jgi:hypothetical protein
VPYLPLVYFLTLVRSLIVPMITKAHKVRLDEPFATLESSDERRRHMSETGGL